MDVVSVSTQDGMQFNVETHDQNMGEACVHHGLGPRSTGAISGEHLMTNAKPSGCILGLPKAGCHLESGPGP